MAGRQSKSNRRKASPKRSWIGLVVVVALLVGALAGLEFVKVSNPPPAPVEPISSPVKPSLTPVSTAVRPVQKTLSSASLRPVAPVAPAKISKGRPGKVAIIIDDMGTNIQEVQALMGIGIPLTFSIIPGLPKATDVAVRAKQHGYQVMIHLPMEPEGYPQRRLEKNGLLLAQTDEETRQQLAANLKSVPGAVGANNHMGSRFTANKGKMQVVLTVLKEKELFFVDSMTSPKSVGFQVAQQLGVKTAVRQVFLDNIQDQTAIRKQLHQLATVARKRGSAIGICHPHPATIKALQKYLPELEQSGITFVTAGDLVR